MNRYKSKFNNQTEKKSNYCNIFGLETLFGGSDAPQQAAGISSEAFDTAIEELRGQFGRTTEAFQPFVEAGREGVRTLGRRRAGLRGLEARLGRIFDTDTFGNLVEERGRAVQGQLAAGGLTRSGTALTEAARVPTEIGLQIEDLISGRFNEKQRGLTNLGFAATGQQAGFGAQTSQGIADLLIRQAEAEGSGILGEAQSEASGTQNLLNTAATVAGIFFSDPSLKMNIEKIGVINDLNLYQWDWISEVKGTIVDKCMTIGFMADEVDEKYPEFINEFGGFKTVDYPNLINAMERKWLH